ncbi:unnamed protein product [Amaranthus hypochondriacus]
MEALVSSTLDVATRLWNCTSSRAAYITRRAETMTSLKTKMAEIKAISNDVKMKVEVAQQHGMKQTEQVHAWLTRVEQTENKVTQILLEDEQIADHSCGYRSSYNLGKKAMKTLHIVEDLIKAYTEFQEVANEQPLPASTNAETDGFYMMQMENPVGVESVLQSVWENLKNDSIRVMGLYGMGGVGKTTILKRINNEIPSRAADHVFDVVIWIVASKNATVEAIQTVILEKMHIPPYSWKDKPVNEKSALIYEILKDKQYILILDDVWQRIDLIEVGVPLLDDQKHGKVIFTTRSEEICGLMQANLRIKVTCLSWERSWALFKEKVGKNALNSHHDIPRLAEMVAKECDGLPLALITIGRAMSCRKTPYEWSHALQMLRKYPSKFSGMGEHVLPVLKFSFDFLPDPTIKKCFIYCSLFPEDYEISTIKLVDLWIGEGFLKGFDEISEARNHGFYVIESLKLACLLESGNISPSKVKMHDVIRDMALWIASDCDERNRKFIVLENTRLINVSHSQNWTKEVEKIFVRGKAVEEPILTHLCDQLSTLIVSSTYLKEIPLRLPQLIPFLKVLDLSGNSILKKLPEISKLSYLEYLDLSRTHIQTLPTDLSNLSRLRVLLLNYMENLKEYPTDHIINDLENLCMFRMNYGPCYSKTFLRALENLRFINEISIYLHSSQMLNIFLNSEKLQNCTRYLRIDWCNNVGEIITKPLLLSTTNMKNLEALQIYNLCSLKTIQIEDGCNANKFWNLRHLIIYRCEQLEDLNCLVYASSLENLWVRKCCALKKIINLVKKDVFPSLKRIRLDNLGNLEFICAEPQSFPILERMYIHDCQKLQELPFADIPIKSSLEFIKGRQNWWDSLSWRHLDLKLHFGQYFQTWKGFMIYETTHGPEQIGSGDWPESSNSSSSNLHESENLKVLRSSMNIWEE